MLRILRITAGIFLIGLLLAGAQLATRDCTADFLRLDNCLWLDASEYLGVPPQNKGLRAVFLGVVGVALLAGIYLTYRFALSPAIKPRATRVPTGDAPAGRMPPDTTVQPQALDPAQKDGS
jgi:hypothetical protein